jgi:hypothetical protein
MSRLAHGLVLAVGMALPVMAWAQEPAAPSFRSGVGVYWMVSPTRYSFVGGAVRLQLPSPVIFSALLEGVLIRNVGADDWIVLADGVLISYVVERTYLGAGGGHSAVGGYGRLGQGSLVPDVSEDCDWAKNSQ